MWRLRRLADGAGLLRGDGAGPVTEGRQCIRDVLAGLPGLEAYFRAHPATSFEGRVKDAAIGGSEHFDGGERSCGNTLRCFASLFLSEQQIEPNALYVLIAGGLFSQVGHGRRCRSRARPSTASKRRRAAGLLSRHHCALHVLPQMGSASHMSLFLLADAVLPAAAPPAFTTTGADTGAAEVGLAALQLRRATRSFGLGVLDMSRPGYQRAAAASVRDLEAELLWADRPASLPRVFFCSLVRRHLSIRLFHPSSPSVR